MDATSSRQSAGCRPPTGADANAVKIAASPAAQKDVRMAASYASRPDLILELDFKVAMATMTSGLLIGQLAARTGVPAATIRYYERIRLIRPSARSAAGYRRYGEAAVAELRFVRKAQALGFSLDEINGILKLSRAGRRPCDQVLMLARRQLQRVTERIDELERLRAVLTDGIARWERQGTAVTADGLCGFIADSEPGEVSLAVSATPRRVSRRAGSPEATA